MGKSTRGAATSRGGATSNEAGPSRSSLRARWEELCASPAYRGRWVALDNPTYLPNSKELVEADVVDVDDDLAVLCARLRASSKKECCVLLCQKKQRSGAPSSRPPSGVRRFGAH